MQNIASNDFNLNIPRYVDTFEAEAEIDIEAIAKEIHDLTQKMAQTDQTIAGFCKELGFRRLLIVFNKYYLLIAQSNIQNTLFYFNTCNVKIKKNYVTL